MANISIDQTYTGAFELVQRDPNGTMVFESVQSAVMSDFQGRTPELEGNTVKWQVAPDGSLAGTAKFITISTHDIVHALLEGTSPEPPRGQKFRQAHVTVHFRGGTGKYKDGHGTAQVDAQLHDDGRTTGRIVGGLTT